MRKIAFLTGLLAGFLLLTGCPKSVPYVPPPVLGSVSLNSQDWTLLYGYGVPAHPSPSGTAWSLTLPGPTGAVEYLQVPFTAGNILPSSITATFRVDSTNAVYNGLISSTPCSNPATMHLFMERRGDNGTQDYYRWWADTGGYVFGSKDGQNVTLTVPLTYTNWSSVFGHQDPAQFQATLGNLMAVGITFGGTGGCWGHGMDVPSGSATLTLIDFKVQ